MSFPSCILQQKSASPPDVSDDDNGDLAEGKTSAKLKKKRFLAVMIPRQGSLIILIQFITKFQNYGQFPQKHKDMAGRLFLIIKVIQNSATLYTEQKYGFKVA